MNPSTETSGKPDDIPQDVWSAAMAVVDAIPVEWPTANVSVAEIARAVLSAKAEEREACAKIAEKGQWEHRSDSPFSMSYAVWVGPRGPDIAAAIRKRGDVNTAHKISGDE